MQFFPCVGANKDHYCENIINKSRDFAQKKNKYIFERLSHPYFFLFIMFYFIFVYFRNYNHMLINKQIRTNQTINVKVITLLAVWL